MIKSGIIKKASELIIGPRTATNEAIDNNKGQTEAVAFREDTEDEQAIKELSRNFAQALNDRDYEHLDSRSEYHLYTVDHLIELIKSDDEQNTKNLIIENKIKSKFEDCEFVSITFSEDKEQAKVVCNVLICIISAGEGYFKLLNKKNNKKTRINEGTPFRTAYTLIVKKEKGIWKVDEFDASQEYIKIDKGIQ